ECEVRLAAQVAGAVRRPSDLITHRQRPVDVLLALGVEEANATEYRKMFSSEKAEICFEPPNAHLIDSRDHAHEPKGTGEELKELVILDVGTEHRSVEPEATIQPFALQTDFVTVRYF